MNLISEYEQVLIGNKERISVKNFHFDPGANERMALSVIKYAVEHLLRWKPEDASRLFTFKVAETMKLQSLFNYIQFPCELTTENTEYVIHLLYPRKVHYNFKKYVLQTYERVMRNEIKYPKDYMYGNKGLIRAGICMQYALKNQKLFHSVEEMYLFFSTEEGMQFIKVNKLHQLYSRFYKTPIDYLHHSLPNSLKNEFYFYYYKFRYLYKKKHSELPSM